MATYTIFGRDNGTGAASAFGFLTSSAATGSAAVAATSATGAGSNPTALTVGYEVAIKKAGNTYSAYESLLEFDTSSANIPSAETVTGVSLKMYGTYTNTPDQTLGLNAYLGNNYNDNSSTGAVGADWLGSGELAGLTLAATASLPAATTVSAGTLVTFTQSGTAFNTGLNRSGYTKVALIPDVVTNNTNFYAGATAAKSTAVSLTSPAVTQNYQSGGVVPSSNKPNIVVTTTTGGAASPQTVTPTGIATGEAFGTATVTVAAPPAQPQTVSPTGIATAAAAGTPVVSVAQAPQTVSLLGQGIPSAAGVGTPLVSGGAAAGQAVIGGLLIKVMSGGTWVSSNGATVAVKRITTADSPYQAKAYQVIVADCSNGPVTVQAPGHGNGIKFTAKKLDQSANPLTVTGNAFDSSGSYQTTVQGQSQDFVSDGAVWLFV